MNGPRRQLLARPALARNQHRRPARGHLLDQRENLLHLRRPAGHLAQHAVVAQLALQALGVFRQPLLCHRPLNQQAQGLRLHGLFQEPKSSQIVNQRQRRFQAPKCRLHNRCRTVALFLQPLQQFLPGHAGHIEIGDNHMGPEASQLIQGILTVSRGFHRIAPQGDHARQGRPLALFVVDHQDSRRGMFRLHRLLSIPVFLFLL